MIRHVWQSWRSVRPGEALVFIGAALLFSAIDLTSLLELRVGDQLPQVLARHLSLSLVSCTLLMLCWLPAARSSPIHPLRKHRLVAATLLGAVLSMAVIYPLAAALPWPSLCEVYAQTHPNTRCSMFRATAIAGDALWLFMPALMIVGVMEFHTVRRRQEQAAQDLLREHSQLRRHALAAQLAALQAQVDPALLFDALVSVEHAYEQQSPDASARLERLIRHLRVALPRLPRPGTSTPGPQAGATLGGEAELIASYLDLMADLGRTPPTLDCDLGPHAGLPLPPMLLLPLVQHVMQHAEPSRCWLRADPHLTLGFDRPGLAGDDAALAALAALRERLAVLDVRLAAHSEPDRTEFTFTFAP
ncbi:histidine kinase [Roseateles sp. BYS87W]|uniref:Histidine kinase n=1 Tax=Pelomonas baiyunensis TaxID=3299026 RepID=A0ABW7GTL9_9BURK